MSIEVPNLNHMIAHVKLGEIQMAIQKAIYVTEYCNGLYTDREDCMYNFLQIVETEDAVILKIVVLAPLTAAPHYLTM